MSRQRISRKADPEPQGNAPHVGVLDVYPSVADATSPFPDAGNARLAVVYREVSSLIPYARNARIHDEAHVAQIAASIREWGWTIPVLIDEHGGIIAGHARILAAAKLNITQAPVIVARGWSDAKKRAYILADNKLTLNAKWDRELLAGEIADLRGVCNLDLAGFSTTEVNRLLEGAGPLDPAAQLDGLNFHVIIDCSGEEQQRQLIDRLQEEGFTCRALIA